MSKANIGSTYQPAASSGISFVFNQSAGDHGVTLSGNVALAVSHGSSDRAARVDEPAATSGKLQDEIA